MTSIRTRVLHVMAGLQPSGMEMMFLSSAEEWRRRGIGCEILATAPEPGPLAGRLAQAGYPIHHLPFRSSHRYLPHFGSMAGLYRLCVERRYDVIHLHTEEASLLFAGAALLAGVPRLALTVHNSFHFRGFLRLRKILERAILRSLGGHFGFVSDAVARNEAVRFFNDGVRITNWVDASRFHPASDELRQESRKSLGVDESTTAVLTVGNCNAAKNHGALLEALSLLPDREDVIYLHVGREEPGEPERAQARELHMSTRVRFAGSQEDVLPWLWAADVFAMPSRHEGLAIAPLEALAAGCPALLAAVDGLAELASAAPHAIFSEPEPEALASALRLMLAMPAAERRERALADSASVRQAFSAAAGVESICSGLYGLVAARHPEIPSGDGSG